MGNTWELTGATWRRSSYSSDTGGECVECAPLDGAAWRKSSYSGNEGGECLEVAATTQGHVALRDSKNPDGGVFAVTSTAFAAFMSAAAQGSL
ncbi:DUF397 domain-containing protein [Streptomyces kunmingensis]|uniref:DUF397 domain-containing protein n=1 Tax=Streptomyces kunmingensis TaxID=68225 RepID=A0ABU6CFM4_9ACTN|nr:DUF397 domain-containing protein [Streptomyces kunmingensis]MEB3963505.1 DUF397 domain-containing protein [Streptomyces kunmingensis]